MRSMFFAAMLPLVLLFTSAAAAKPSAYKVSEDARTIHIETAELAATVAKKGYVTGIAAQSFLDKKTGFRDPGFGLDIVDWIMEPGSDAAYRDRLSPELIYRTDGEFHNYHGSRLKRSLEGPQICTQARELQPAIIRGKDFVAIRQQFTYRTAAPGKKAGSVWTQLLVFPQGKRYLLSMDRIDAVNSSEAMFLRVDMPGHVRHTKGDTFSEIYLSYHGQIPAAEFLADFPPDARFDYRRDRDPLPERFIRGYRLRDPVTKKDGPWLLGMTLDPSVVCEAWCHQRGYVCMIEEFGGRPIRPGQSFSAAFLVGYFDTLDEANRAYDACKGHTALEATADGWKLVRSGRGSEPFLPRLSLSKATEYLDARAHAHENNCCACHATFAYLPARPVISTTTPAHREVRQALEAFAAKLPVAKLDPQKAPPLDVAEAVMSAAVLAQHDAATGKTLHPLTRKALDRIWDLQREDGGWNWVKSNHPPSESDDHFGVTMAAIGVGTAPDHYADTPQARKGLDRIRRYLREHRPANMHQRAMLLLAAGCVEGLLTDRERRESAAELFALQRPDGGWAMASLGDWKRVDGVPLDPATSDGYGTGFAVYVLRRGGRIAADDPRLQKGVSWLEGHQRTSGCWFTRSPYQNDELSTYVGTTYAVLALDACKDRSSREAAK